jgi:hypothetical protein
MIVAARLSAQRLRAIASSSGSSRSTALAMDPKHHDRAPLAMATRSLIPHEHGAYGQIGLPLVAALADGRPTIASGLFALGAVAAFFAHEPLLVAIGRRGRRAQKEDGARARVRLGLLSTVALAAMAGGVALAPSVGSWLALPVGLGALVAIAIFGRAERTLAGEIVAASALAASALPVALAAGAPVERALAAWGAWALGFAGVTAAVRALLPARRAGDPRAAWGVVAGALVAAALLAERGVVEAWAAGPLVLASLALLALRPHPRHLRAVGVVLVCASALSAALIVAL